MKTGDIIKKCNYPKRVYKSSQPSYLTRNMSEVHNGEKNFKCEYCEKTYAQKDQLNKHNLTVHGNIKPNKCTYCEYETSQSQYVRNHILAFHEREKPCNIKYSFLCN